MRRIAQVVHDDDQDQMDISAAKGWENDLPEWRHAYASYRRWLGNPFKVAPSPKSDALRKAMAGLYDARGGGSVIKSIRDTLLSSCPMCGSGSVGTVDHYLPRESYAEFSIFTPNLVPTCSLCNQKAKRTTVKGNHRSERFIHPYFSRLAERPLWQVRFERPLAAVTFTGVALAALSVATQRRVRFHLENVLETQFSNSMRTMWPDHADWLVKALARAGRSRMTAKFVREETEGRLSCEEIGGKHNSWRSAFYRGLLDDQDAMAWLAANAATIR